MSLLRVNVSGHVAGQRQDPNMVDVLTEDSDRGQKTEKMNEKPLLAQTTNLGKSEVEMTSLNS